MAEDHNTVRKIFVSVSPTEYGNVSKNGVAMEEPAAATASLPFEQPEVSGGEEPPVEPGPSTRPVKRRKKYHTMADEYRLNRIMRDKDFKLERSNFYSFKDTLGDWDERATQFLIQLIQKYPKCHFILSSKTVKRMVHWESAHKEMEMAGYTFTILQLRMRWREVLQKYRWTVDYNDSHEIKKRCEYFDEMNHLFGEWDNDATSSLLNQMHRVKLENINKKIMRIGFSGWEKITENINCDGYRFSVDMVEARWRNLVTLYKTMVDHNALPNVEVYTIAYKEDLEKLVNYVPKRRHNYEKVKGRSVKYERFPSNGSRILLQAYKESVQRFMDPNVENNLLWDEITEKLKEEGLDVSAYKVKEILNGMIKGFEKCQYHNSLPGAIRRDVPYYRQLAEIFGVCGRWPHAQTSRTMKMRTLRKFRLRLQASQQLWSSKESRTLLEVYPHVLEGHVSQTLSYQSSDLWLQVAKAYAATGYPKRDVPEIAIHIGLLRQGYAQGNLFPFKEEMRRVKEMEEAVCYSPDVSKFTGDVEITYWSHAAVNHLLAMYIEHQGGSSSPGNKEIVFEKIKADMSKLGYGYSKEEIQDQFRIILTQYNTRKSKLCPSPSAPLQSHNPDAASYWNLLQEVIQLRRSLSLSWTKGAKALSSQAREVLYNVARQEVERIVSKKPTSMTHSKIITQILQDIQIHIKLKKLLDPVPKARQMRLHLLDALRKYEEQKETNEDVAFIHHFLKAHNMTKLFQGNLTDSDILELKSRAKKSSRKRKGNYTNTSIGVKFPKNEKALLNSLHSEDSSEDEDFGSVPYFDGLDNSKEVKHIEDPVKECLVLGLDHLRKSVDKDFADLERKEETDLLLEETDRPGARVDMACDNQSDLLMERTELLYKQLYKNNYNIFPCTKPVSENESLYKFVNNNQEITLIFPRRLKHHDVSSNSRGDIPENKRRLDSLRTSSERRGNSDCMSTKTMSDRGTNASPQTTVFNQYSDIDKIKIEPETRIIQTRSDRKTRFTFFSKMLAEISDYDDDDDDDDIDIKSTSAASTFDRPKRQSRERNRFSPPQTERRKRGRPQKKHSSSKSVLLNPTDVPEATESKNKESQVNMKRLKLEKYEALPRKEVSPTRFSNPEIPDDLVEENVEFERSNEKIIHTLKTMHTEQNDVISQMRGIFKNLREKLA
ncbi:uncharacterized protein LOC122252260 [Penaeus japonicus]|uniref:uncharacterized protein LOC122252260 n=1 Tax=Penaeus japonicus TaxID=27405 RepID=UPI001C7146D5|nr:uncharacterized protein LOC122252260 [Penaeus japonicus]